MGSSVGFYRVFDLWNNFCAQNGRINVSVKTNGDLR